MIIKSLIAATAVAAAMAAALPASEAKADVDVDIGIGVGGAYPGYGYYDGYRPGYYGHGYGYGYRPGYYGHRYDDGISCRAGRRIVDRSGFDNVRAIDCEGPNYRYSAWKRGHKYVVRVNSDGDITRIRRVD